MSTDIRDAATDLEPSKEEMELAVRLGAAAQVDSTKVGGEIAKLLNAANDVAVALRELVASANSGVAPTDTQLPAPKRSAAPPPPATLAPPPSANTPVKTNFKGRGNPTGVKSYISKVLRSESGISADMFHLPEGMSAAELDGLCLQFNYAMKQAGRDKDARYAELITSGQPFADKTTTGEVDANKLPEVINFLWRKVTEGQSGATLPTAAKLREDAIAWQPGLGVDPIAEHRASEIANVKVAGPKSAAVTPKALREANQELERVGSFIRLVPSGPETPEGFVPIRPEWNGERKVTADHDESHAKVAKLNAERQVTSDVPAPVDKTHQFVSWADCHRTAQMIMGSEDKASGIMDSEHVAIGTGTSKVAVPPIPKGNMEHIALATDHGANRGMHALFNAAMPDFRDQLIKEAGKEVPKGDAAEVVALINEAIAEAKEGKPANFRKAYQAIYQSGTLGEKFSAKYGVNSHAAPRVGDALTQINDEQEKKQSEDRDLWNFHFAGVILTNPDGSYMTLENLSVENTIAVNDDWYFAVYDPAKGKDFHTVNAKDSHVGTRPITMCIQKA